MSIFLTDYGIENQLSNHNFALIKLNFQTKKALFAWLYHYIFQNPYKQNIQTYKF